MFIWRCVFVLLIELFTVVLSSPMLSQDPLESCVSGIKIAPKMTCQNLAEGCGISIDKFLSLNPTLPVGRDCDGALVSRKQVCCKSSANQTRTGMHLNGCIEDCGGVYRPVCGSDDLTYFNECVLNLMACENGLIHLKVKSEGNCRTGIICDTFFH